MAIEATKEDSFASIRAPLKLDGGEFIPIAGIPTLRDGERLIGILPNGVVEVEDAHVRDTISAEQTTAMRVEQELIMTRLTPGERQTMFCALSPHLRAFSARAASYFALEELYTLGKARLPGKIEVDDNGEALVWYKCFENARAVRERGIVTKRLLTEAVHDQIAREPNLAVEITSIASGSARCVLEVIQEFENQGMKVKARMLDRDAEALAYSKQLAIEMGLIDESEETKNKEEIKIEFIIGNVVRLNGPVTRRPSHIVEAVGIMDYLDKRTCVNIFLPAIYKLLASGGTLVASNIVDNSEREFLETAVKWPQMQYRDSDEFSRLFSDTNVGFRPEDCKLHRNSNGIYRIIEARKPVISSIVNFPA